MKREKSIQLVQKKADKEEKGNENRGARERTARQQTKPMTSITASM